MLEQVREVPRRLRDPGVGAGEGDGGQPCGAGGGGVERNVVGVVGCAEGAGLDELEGAVRNLPETRKSTLALQADKKASFGTIIKVMDALKLAGVRNLPAFTREEK